jgi:hypothetical protein
VSKAGRLSGIIIFTAGIAMVVAVFFMARSIFSGITASPAQPGAAGDVARNVLAVILQAVLLVVMALAGSLLASKGIQLYIACGGPIPPGRSPSDKA